ncbi:MAG: NADH-quinone oxidoreductase subunit J [Anaerolineaceae bacterium]|nr:NADH-quinone oxidoreductase subunit J [Anaerolineaceae bacterium]
MTPLQVIFLLVAAVTLVAAVLVVTSRRMLHAALWLILALFGVAVVFAMLQAGFFAVIQVVVYIGAIAILIIFAIMLTRRVMEDSGPQVNRSWPFAGLAVVILLVGLVAAIGGWSGFNNALPDYTAQAQNASVAQLGLALVSADAYVLPFEAASVLLLSALIGAIFVAWEKK